MSLVVNLPPSQEKRIHREAQKAGVSANELIQRTLAEHFPDDIDEDAKALALVEQWISEAPTTPQQQQEAEDDLIEFQKAINQTRQQAGSRILYPGVK